MAASNLGVFHPEVIKKVNKLLKKFPLAPGNGNDDECTYFVGYFNKKEGVVEYWTFLDRVGGETWGGDFLKEWNELKDLVLFTGEIFVLESPGNYLVGEGYNTNITISDRVVRCFRKNTSQTVLDVLGQAYHILFNPEILATLTQGVIGKIHIDKEATVPTLVFEHFTD